jgi:hypothetical protein
MFIHKKSTLLRDEGRSEKDISFRGIQQLPEGRRPPSVQGNNCAHDLQSYRLIFRKTSYKKIEISAFELNARWMKQATETPQPNYVVPLLVSQSTAVQVATDFLQDRKSKTRLALLCGALFEIMAIQRGMCARVDRGNTPKRRAFRPHIFDLECINEDGKVVMAVEIKKQALTLADLCEAITKSRCREIQEVFFTAPKVNAPDAGKIKARLNTAFAAGQSFYVFDFFSLARAVLALGGNAMRRLFLQKVGDHLDTWATQPSHRQAWKRLLESL